MDSATEATILLEGQPAELTIVAGTTEVAEDLGPRRWMLGVKTEATEMLEGHLIEAEGPGDTEVVVEKGMTVA